jgi:hypothetical protein
MTDLLDPQAGSARARAVLAALPPASSTPIAS